jgi:hypothetical protein
MLERYGIPAAEALNRLLRDNRKLLSDQQVAEAASTADVPKLDETKGSHPGGRRPGSALIHFGTAGSSTVPAADARWLAWGYARADAIDLS